MPESGRPESTAVVTNLFDRQYANFGMLGNNAFNGGNRTNENSWGVGQPRAFYLGLRAIM